MIDDTPTARLSEADITFLVFGVLPIYQERMREYAAAWQTVADAGGNGVATADGARHLANQFRLQGEQAAELQRRLEGEDA